MSRSVWNQLWYNSFDFRFFFDVDWLWIRRTMFKASLVGTSLIDTASLQYVQRLKQCDSFRQKRHNRRRLLVLWARFSVDGHLVTFCWWQHIYELRSFRRNRPFGVQFWYHIRDFEGYTAVCSIYCLSVSDYWCKVLISQSSFKFLKLYLMITEFEEIDKIFIFIRHNSVHVYSSVRSLFTIVCQKSKGVPWTPPPL